MRKKRRILPVTLVMAVLGVVGWLALRPREPEYQGKSLSQLLDNLVTNSVETGYDPSRVAIYKMGPRTIPYLMDNLHRKDTTRQKVLTFLQTKFPADIARYLPKPDHDAYLSALASQSTGCLAALGEYTRGTLPDLIETLNTGSAPPGSLNYAILEIGPQPEHLPALISLLKNSTNLYARHAAASALGAAGLASPEVLAALTNAVADGTPFLPAVAIDSLGKLGSGAEAAVPLLTRNLDDPAASSFVRAESAAALWKIHGKTNVSVAWVARELDDDLKNNPPPLIKDFDYMENYDLNILILTQLLGEMGPQAQAAVPVLQRVRGSPKTRLRLAAAKTLWEISRETNELVAICTKAMTHPDTYTRIQAAEFLAEFCAAQQVVPPEFESALTNSKDIFIRFYAARALWKVKGRTDNTIPVLLAGLEDHYTYYQNRDIRKLAAETLGEMGPKAQSAVPALQVALEDPRSEVRAAAAAALKKIDPTRAVEKGR